jgi:hypothetical protein
MKILSRHAHAAPSWLTSSLACTQLQHGTFVCCRHSRRQTLLVSLPWRASQRSLTCVHICCHKPHSSQACQLTFCNSTCAQVASTAWAGAMGRSACRMASRTSSRGPSMSTCHLHRQAQSLASSVQVCIQRHSSHCQPQLRSEVEVLSGNPLHPRSRQTLHTLALNVVLCSVDSCLQVRMRQTSGQVKSYQNWSQHCRPSASASARSPLHCSQPASG